MENQFNDNANPDLNTPEGRDKAKMINDYKPMKKKTKKDLKPFNEVIQICPECKKIGVYLNDGHVCDAEYQAMQQESEDNFYK